jgi:hypothetical protein
MTIDPSAAHALAARLRSLHDEYKSWRKVRKFHFPEVPAGTLCRIAKSGGDYLPRDRRKLRALGLLEMDEATAYERRFKRAFTRLLKELRS